MKILVVDDNREMLSVLCEKLNDKGYEVIATSNVVESLRIIADEKVDMVISDVMMPCFSGFTLITMLKNFYFNNIPVILISDCDQEKTLLNIHGARAHGFFAMPIDYQGLFNRIEECSQLQVLN